MSTLQFDHQSEQAPQLIQVASLGVIEVTGADTQKFLQGQFTCDMKATSWQTWLAGGYCNPKGKLWSTFRVVGDAERVLIFLAKDSLETTLAGLKKYGVFSKVTITDITTQQPMYALWGKGAASNIAFEGADTVSKQGDTCFIKISDSFVLIHGDYDVANQPLMPDTWWQAAMFEHAWVDVPPSATEEYIPQMLNLDKNQGINFKKGCYLGQEVVARIHYKGQNKRVTHRFIGKASELPEAGTRLEKKVSENWRRSGAVLSAVRYHDDVVALYAVGPIDLEPTDLFRIQGQDDSQFTLCPATQNMES